MNIEDKIELVKSLLYPSLNHSGYDRFDRDEKRKAEQQQQRKIQQEEEERRQRELQTKQSKQTNQRKIDKVQSLLYPSLNHSGYDRFDRDEKRKADERNRAERDREAKAKQRRDQQDKQRRDNIEKVKYTLYPSIDTSEFDRYDVERNDTIIQKNKDVKDVSKYNEIYRKLYGDDPNIEEKLKYIRPVSNVNMGEKCTIEVAKDEDLYNENTIFDSKKIKNINQIQRTSHEHVLKQKPYSVCNYDMVNDTATRNCALTSPFLTSEGNKCKITNGVCPDGFKFKDGDCVFKDLVQFEKDKVAFCANKWYDWFRVPNYHLNNGYQKYRSKSAKHKHDVTKCYEPCDFKEVPYVQKRDDYENTNMGKCILKNNLFFGTYSGIDYCPISLVHLLGIDKGRLHKRYIDYVDSTTKPTDKMRDDVYALQKTENSNIVNTAMDEIVGQAKKYIEKGGMSINDIVEPGTEEGKKCAEIVDKEDIENAYYICLDMMENPEELKAKLKKQYRYNDDRKLNKHVDALNNACKVCFEINEPDGIFNTSVSNYAKLNWKILEGEFPEKEYKRLEFERKTEPDGFMMSSSDKKKSSRQITDDDKVKNADNASIMYNIKNMMKFQHIIDDDSKISYMMPMVMWTIVGFIILIIVLMLWMYKEKIWYSYLKPLLEFLWKSFKWLLILVWRVLFVILFPVMRFLPFRF